MTPVLYDDIIIHAALSSIWHVLVEPDYIRQWDGLPQNYDAGQLKTGSEIVWDFTDGGYMKSIVVYTVPCKLLEIETIGTDWRFTPVANPMLYQFGLLQHGQGARLTIRISNFSQHPNGEDFYEAGTAFAKEAKEKIKTLAEQQTIRLR